MVDILTDEQREAEKICAEGIDLYEQEKNAEGAHRLFQKAYQMDPASPKINSWLGMTYAVVERKVPRALEHCRKAIESQIPDVYFYRNIGKAYLAKGDKRAAIGAFAKGLQIEKGNRAILEEWKVLGFRRKPFFRFLDRSHALNLHLGKFTWWLRHRNKK